MVENLVGPAFFQVGLAQHLLVVRAHQDRQIGLLFHEGRLVELFFNDDVDKRHRQRRVAALLDGHPQVGVDGAGVHVGRGGDNARAVVLRFPDVVGVRNAGGIRVDHAQHDVVRIEPGVRGEALQRVAIGQVRAGVEVAHHREAVELDAAHQRGKAAGAGVAHHGLVARALVCLELAGAVFFKDVDHLVGDLFGGLVPGDALPLAGAALARPLERVADAVCLVHGGGVDGAFLAAARVGVGHFRVDRGVFGNLLFANDDAVFDEDVKRAVAHAVDAVRRMAHLVPGPLVAVQVFPAAVRVLGLQRVLDGFEAVECPDVVAADDASADCTKAF